MSLPTPHPLVQRFIDDCVSISCHTDSTAWQVEQAIEVLAYIRSLEKECRAHQRLLQKLLQPQEQPSEDKQS